MHTQTGWRDVGAPDPWMHPIDRLLRSAELMNHPWVLPVLRSNWLTTQTKSPCHQAVSAEDTVAESRLQRSNDQKPTWFEPPGNLIFLPSKTLLHSNQLLSTVTFYSIPYIDFVFHTSRQRTKSLGRLSQLNFKVSPWSLSTTDPCGHFDSYIY